MQRLIMMLILSFMFSGCSSIYTLSSDFDKKLSKPDTCPQDCTVHRIYSGVSMDICMLRSESPGQGGAIAFWDLPFSFALDTVILPYTVYKQVTVGGSVSQQLGPISKCDNTHNKSINVDSN